ncbi:DNA topology modulation protein [Virgibacillus proomii]|uniref:DNA topology modulation protein n=1 Tax=Virgibacillus proomii TaxID=84407 RepID=UPI001C10C582|nr:DNA topology modulation protein [Virgibacillus proomii]MBU5266322.1 DNA topology modulation protein [Virgibacillus proomii]
MKKIMIIGIPGAGKSTLAKQLNKFLQIPVYHMDKIFWKSGWKQISRKELIAETQKIFKKETWIIDGNYSATMEMRMKEADPIIFLHYRTMTCLYGIIKRRITYHNKTRPDLGTGCREKLDWEFFNYVRTFNKKKTSYIYELLSAYTSKDILIFRNRKELTNFLRKIG